jgi:GntR family transcriptional regulator
MSIPAERDPRAYVRVAAQLRRRIEDGELSPGDAVPSITTLQQETGHARATVGKALRLLEAEGYVSRYAGLGYFVVDPKPGRERKRPS